MKSALSSILVVLGVCDRASPTSKTVPAGSEPSAIAVTSTTPMLKLGRWPMHPDVVSDKPGLCPKCNMKLDPKPQVAEVRPSETAESPELAVMKMPPCVCDAER